MEKRAKEEQKKYLDLINNTKTEIHKVIIGMDKLIDCMLIALFCPPRQPGEPFGSHILIEGSHGLGKSKLVETMARCIDLRFERFQGDNEKLPSDITGFEYPNPQDISQKIFQKGPVFSDLVLADEINRINPKCQSAFLQPMEERRVIIGEKEYHLSEFLRVFATINPNEEQGTSTYALPVAQIDRFIINFKVTRLSEEEELRVISGDTQSSKDIKAGIMTKKDICDISKFINENFSSKKLEVIINKITRKTAEHKYVQTGASIRNGADMRRLAQSLAFISGDEMVLPRHIREASLLALRGKLLLKNEYAFADQTDIISEILKQTSF